MAFYVKTNDHAPLVPEAAEALFGGAATNQSITLSGVTPTGEDGTNDLSYLFLKAIDLLRMREPNVDARFHEDSPKIWYEKVLEVIRSTGAAPALYNDDAIVPSLTSKGVTLEDGVTLLQHVICTPRGSTIRLRCQVNNGDARPMSSIASANSSKVIVTDSAKPGDIHDLSGFRCNWACGPPSAYMARSIFSGSSFKILTRSWVL